MEALPEELLCEIAAWLGAVDLWALSLTSRQLRRIARDSRLWRRVRCAKRTPAPLLGFAAAVGNSHAAFVLGARLHFGEHGAAVDIPGAVRWYSIAARNGSATANYNLGCLLDKGAEGLPRDPVAANERFRAAAHLGLAAAQNALAINYELGVGTERSFHKAVFWYRKAADSGLSDALFNLGLLHFYGRGVRQDLAEAYRLFKRAAVNDSDSAVWCERVATLLHTQQR